MSATDVVEALSTAGLDRLMDGEASAAERKTPGPGSHSVGWLTNSIQQDLVLPHSIRLTNIITEIEAREKYSDAFIAGQHELRARILEASATIAKRNSQPDWKDAKTLREKLRVFRHRAGDVTEKTCKVLLHYQQMFDALNEQAPEYTTAIWGAVKLLSLFLCNESDIRSKLENQLDGFICRFESLNIVTMYPMNERVQQAVTEAVESFVDFLEKALHFFNQNGLKRRFKSLVQPWETKFADVVIEVDAKIEFAYQLAGSTIKAETGVMVHHISQKVDSLVTMSYFDRRMEEFLAARHMAPSEHEIRRLVGQEVNGAFAASNSYAMEATGCDGRSKFGTSATKLSVPITDLLHRGKGLYSSFEEVFHGITILEQPIAALAPYFNREAAEKSHAFQNLCRSWKVANFIREQTSKLLWVYGYRDQSEVDWMLNFTLGVLSSVHARSRIFCLYAFCGVANQSLPTGSVSVCSIMQSLIVQLIGHVVRPEASGHSKNDSTILSRKVCKEYELNTHRFAESEDNIEELFFIFEDLLELVNPENLFIIIDGIHHLYAGAEGTEAREDTRFFFERLLQLTNDQTPDSVSLVKVVITSRFPETPKKLLGEEVTPAIEYSTIKVNRQLVTPAPASDLRKRKYRLPRKPDDPRRARDVDARLAAGDTTFLDEDSADENRLRRSKPEPRRRTSDSEPDSMDEFIGSHDGLTTDSDDNEAGATRNGHGGFESAGDLDDDDPIKAISRTDTGIERDRLIERLDDSGDERPPSTRKPARSERIRGGIGPGPSKRASRKSEDENFDDLDELLEAGDEI